MEGAGTSETVLDRLRTAPVLAHAALASKQTAEWLAGIDVAASREALCQPQASALLAGIADHSPYLWSLLAADPGRAAHLLSASPEASLAAIVAGLDSADLNVPIDDVMRRLRKAKQELALLVALADLGGVWGVAEVTAALTAFADAAVRHASRVLLAEAVRGGKLLPPSHGEAEEAGCGLVILALGKQGAHELNYSSDIDLIVLFDPEAPRLIDRAAAAPVFVRLTQRFVRLMQERTADGYVLRVDLRLRPDPASTGVAIALPSAFSYYERHGQNWERAAFIKARPVAGDLALGDRFLGDLSPFIWRKYFDYAAIADIHAMKRQIHAVRGQAQVAVAGHNIKLGRGGIREIEFFVQTQQLIFGGRRPALRGRETLVMLVALQADGWITADAVSELSAAYRFLRTIEHRLQMVGDDQTQTLPDTAAGLEVFARFAGFANADAFGAALTDHLRCVESHYARLFEHAPGLDSAAGSLVFTGTGPDPETLDTLRALGFARPENAAEIIRGWHFGRRAAVQSSRAREVVTELVPSLLDAFSGSADPDAALATMDTMLARMPAAIELFSLLRSNRAVRELFADVVGSAPRLAATIASRPHILDAAIDPANMRGRADRRLVVARLQAAAGAPTTEEFLDRVRDIVHEELFLVGVRLLSGTEDPIRTGEVLTDLADAVIGVTLERCIADFARDHGTLAGGACVVLGMGKLGSREMTVTSDLDLIVIYRFSGGESDGPRPLDGVRYYSRLTQRLIAALTAPTRRGRLYQVDVRLRPSGRQGPLATQLRAFANYQATEAQTWEHMALTRARVVAGDPSLAAELDEIIRNTLRTKRHPSRLRADVRSMRALIAREKGDADVWDMKLAAGGLLDVEFVAQFLVLQNAAEHPSLLLRSPVAVIEQAGRLGLLAESEAAALSQAYRVQTTAAQLTRLTVEGRFDPGKAGSGVLKRLAAAVNEPDVGGLTSVLAEVRGDVLAIRERLMG